MRFYVTATHPDLNELDRDRTKDVVTALAEGYIPHDSFDYILRHLNENKEDINHIDIEQEELEITKIRCTDMEELDAELFDLFEDQIKTVQNLAHFMEVCESLEDYQKVKLIIYIDDLGCEWDLESPDNFSSHYEDMEVHQDMNYTELAESQVDEGLWGDIPEHLQYYIDYEKMGNDLQHDYNEIDICGKTYIYREY